MELTVPLPPVEMRQGGGPLKYDDDFFVESARLDIDHLTTLGLAPQSRFLDFGCGPGRLAFGLMATGWSGSYVGVEVKERHVQWATSAITPRFPDFRFVHVDAANDRYNPAGSDARKLPVDDGSVDMIAAFSVFTHMLSDDTTTYLREFRRVLAPGGKAFITVFMADGVPDETENPSWFGNWEGRLHCVLYSTNYLKDLISASGMSLERVLPRREGHKQDELLLIPKPL
jgi:SAM-dependent methyltransferase